MFEDYVWNTKLGRFNITVDTQNISLGFELDWSKPFSIDIYLPFIKFGWMAKQEEEPSIYSDELRMFWEVPTIPPEQHLKFEIRNKDN